MVYTLKECVVIGSGISGLAVMIFLLLEIHRSLIDIYIFIYESIAIRWHVG